MDSKRFRLVLVGILVFLILVFVVICVFGLSLLKSESDKMVDSKLKNETADAQLASLEASKKTIAEYSYFKSIASSVIPNDKDQAEAVLEIFQIAQQAGIALQSVSFPASSLGLQGSSAAPPATGDSSATVSKTISQAKPVSGIPGLYSVQLTITPATGSQVSDDQRVTYAKMLSFLKGIESNRRTAQITQVNIQPSDSGSNDEIDFTLTVNIFIKP